MRIIAAAAMVGALIIIALAGFLISPYGMAVAVPYAALAIFLAGIVWRVIDWARSPVPFRIPTTCGQQKSLPWIRNNELDAPSSTLGVLGRMALEILLFRSLFRNTKAEYKKDHRFVYTQEMFLWAAALAFHWSFLIIVLRHFRFFTHPVPAFVIWLQNVDGFFEFLFPTLFISDVIILAALTYLFFRRIYYPHLRYISLVNDYFPLFLIITITLSGVLMRHVPSLRVDIEAVKVLTHGLFSLHPPSMETVNRIGPTFFVHLFLVSMLLAYFPFSKLMHMPGIFLSPTRNLANNNRRLRHINPWNYPVKTHTYAQWEEEFHKLIKEAGLPREKE